MQIFLGGVRGTTPRAAPRFTEFGGHTTCLLVTGTTVPHPNGCTAWRVDEPATETAFVFATDTEWSAADETQRENLITLCRDPDCLTCGRGELYHGQGDEGRRAVGGHACDRVDFVVGGHDGGVVDVLAVIPGS